MNENLTEKQKALIKKIQALAERGVGGEKETAQRKLRALMEKYGIESLELDEERVQEHEFHYAGPIERKILIQIIYKVLKEADLLRESVFSYKYGPGSRSTKIVHCTEAQAIEIRIQFDFYKDLWKEEQDLLLDAFIQHHRLFGNGSAEERELTPEELERLRRMAMMEGGLQEKSIRPLLEGGEGHEEK